jgi:A/G-specific adenine glycosylase
MQLINPTKFNNYVSLFYKKNKRDLHWRREINPYYILISEFMLQQTQVSRVINYFNKFISILPTLESLAHATQELVLSLWSGLGYNRRALYLANAAKIIWTQYNGIIPNDYNELLKIKGIGDYTAKAIITYSYNIPLIFVETNIRSVFFIYCKDLFEKNHKTDDTIIKELIEITINKENPRDWYYSLMDLGTHLKKKYKDQHIQKSKFFTIQSKFIGSTRQIRGKIITLLLEKKNINYTDLLSICNDSRSIDCIKKLTKENFIYRENNIIYLKQ